MYHAKSISAILLKVYQCYPTQEIELPEGLETVNTTVTLKSGPNHRLTIPVLNKSKD